MQHHITMNHHSEQFWLGQLANYVHSEQLPVNDAQLADKQRQLRQQHVDPAIIECLEKLVRMRRDTDWSLSASQATAIDAMQAYLLEDNDMVPDHVPGIGLLDDAMVIMAVARRLQKTLSAFGEYEHFKRHYAHGRRFTPADWQRFKAQEIRSNNRVRRLRRISAP